MAIRLVTTVVPLCGCGFYYRCDSRFKTTDDSNSFHFPNGGEVSNWPSKLLNFNSLTNETLIIIDPSLIETADTIGDVEALV